MTPHTCQHQKKKEPKTKKPLKCATRYCTNKRRKGRKLCETCTCREYRKRNPMRAAFKTLRDNAKRRGKEFTLTFSEFTHFCNKTEYLAGKGRSSDSFSIDRIDNDLGYTLSNIRVMTVSDNSKKGTKQLLYDWRTRTATVVTNRPQVHHDSDLF